MTNEAPDTQREIRSLRAALEPFAHPARTSRIASGGDRPEDDDMTINCKAADWMRACIALGTMDADYLRILPPHAKPSEDFLATIS